VLTTSALKAAELYNKTNTLFAFPKAKLPIATPDRIINAKWGMRALHRLDGYNLGAGFDLDHTTVELLNDAMQRPRWQNATTAPYPQSIFREQQ
jgi:hypothetical protein